MACVRVCPVEAIAVSGDEVRIADETCIECGLCVPACHHDAIDVVGDLASVRTALEEHTAVLVLPSEAIVYFYPATPEQLINACFAIGFEGIYPELLGDELVAQAYLDLWEDLGDDETWLRSTSPIVVDYLRAKHPDLLEYLAPITTPTVALARHLRNMLDDETKIVYTGLGSPGLNNGDDVDACISFSELEQLFRHYDALPREQPMMLARMPAERRRHLSTAGGLPLAILEREQLASRRFRKVRGLRGIDSLARAIEEEDETLGFVDVLPFDGALDHPALGPHEELFVRRGIAELAEEIRSDEPVIECQADVSLEARFEGVDSGLPPADPADVEQILEQIGTAPGDRYWDCGACGHARCVDFARAMARGRASLLICPYYMSRQYQEAARDATHDALTGLYSYRTLDARLEEEVARANRSGASLAVMFVDLDDFKRINDTYGHQVGNEILKGIGNVINHAIRSTDIAARFGGDEFVVILVNADRLGAARVAEQIRKDAANLKVMVPDGEVGITLSIGLAYHSGAARSVLTSEALMAEADASLYVAKAQGGNSVHPVHGEELVR
jgi:diguanylate cyclase (GGDEF)-like protein